MRRRRDQRARGAAAAAGAPQLGAGLAAEGDQVARARQPPCRGGVERCARGPDPPGGRAARKQTAARRRLPAPASTARTRPAPSRAAGPADAAHARRPGAAQRLDDLLQVAAQAARAERGRAGDGDLARRAGRPPAARWRARPASAAPKAAPPASVEAVIAPLRDRSRPRYSPRATTSPLKRRRSSSMNSSSGGFGRLRRAGAAGRLQRGRSRRRRAAGA